MKLAIFGSVSSPHVKRWANSLATRDIDVHLISIHNNEDLLSDKIVKHNLRTAKPFGYIINIPELRALIKQINPDVVHSFYALGYGTLGTYSGVKPHVISVMGSDIYDDVSNPILRRFVINNIRKADIVCSTSHTMAKQIEKITGIAESDIEYTPFGIDIEKFKPIKGTASREESETDSDKVIFGTVKFLEDKYGIDILLQAYAIFRLQNPALKSRLVIVGNGSKEHQLKHLSKRLKIENYCDFIGFQAHDNIPELLQLFDVFVALSRFDSESFGVAVLEASACGLPVIVSNVGGLPEVVQNGMTGIVVENENPKEAANVMTKLATNSELKLKLGKNGRERVKVYYNWEKSVDRMMLIYQNLVQ